MGNPRGAVVTSVRGSRAPAAAVAIGLATLVLLTAVPSAGAATPAGFRGAAWNPVLYKSVGGCARGHATVPGWTRSTGDGTWRASGHARTCPKAQGGSATPSYADAEGELTIQSPVLLPTGAGGVNISWSIAIAAATAGKISG
ncbi:MAG TPA: hypothetical protein VMH90_03905, partial [Thermoplasmata archaeon]|nr:hypothetical protein [Thermoplasmata archaeon]